MILFLFIGFCNGKYDQSTISVPHEPALKTADCIIFLGMRLALILMNTVITHSEETFFSRL